MAEITALLPSQIDFAQFSLGKKEKSKNGPASYCPLSYKGKPLYLQCPRMRIFTDLVYKGKDKDKDKDGAAKEESRPSFNFSLDTSNPKVAEFKAFLEKLDDCIANLLAKNSVEVLGKSRTAEQVRDINYTSGLVKKPSEANAAKNYADRFNPKLAVYENGKAGFDIYKDSPSNKVNFCKVIKGPDYDPKKSDKEQRFEVNWDWFTKNMDAKAIVKISCIWLINNKDAYPGVNVHAAIVYDPPKMAVAFQDDGEITVPEEPAVESKSGGEDDPPDGGGDDCGEDEEEEELVEEEIDEP